MENIEELPSLLKKLNQIDDMAIEGDVSHHFLEFKLSKDQGGFVVTGNRFGLVHLAKFILELASSGSEGSHIHFDEVGIVDKCDVPLIIRLKAADWEE